MIKILILFVLLICALPSTVTSIDAIEPGLYLQTSEELYTSDTAKIDDIKFLYSEQQNIYLTDGKTFRRGKGFATEKIPEKELRTPLEELNICNREGKALCFNKKYSSVDFYYKILSITERGIEHESYDEKSNISKPMKLYFVRIATDSIAVKYIKEFNILKTFPGKTYENFGYREPVQDFVTGSKYRSTPYSLIIREKASRKSKSIGKLEFHEVVVALESTNTIDRIDDIKGRWVKIRTSTAKEGYVFGGFLEPVGE